MLLRLPDDIAAGVKDDDAVDIDVVNGEIMVRSVDWPASVSMRRFELPSYVELHSATDEDPTTLITTSQCMGRVRHVLTPKSSDTDGRWSMDEWRPWAPIFGVDDVDGIRQAIEVLKLYPDGHVKYDDFELVTEESSAVREETLGPVEPVEPIELIEPVGHDEPAPIAPIASVAPAPVAPVRQYHDVEQELLAKLLVEPNALRRTKLQRQLDEHRKRAQ